jgi:hypothetical protein
MATITLMQPQPLLPDARHETRTFQTSIAKMYGLDGAVFLHQLNFHLGRPTCIVDGQPWYEVSYATLQAKDFPFWNEKKIERTALKLARAGIVIIRRRRQKRYDQTNWYTIDQDKLQKLRQTRAAVQTDKLSASRETVAPPDETDKMSLSLEVQEERKKREPDVSALPQREEANNPPEEPPTLVAEHNQDGGTAPPEQSSPNNTHLRTEHALASPVEEEKPMAATTESTPVPTLRQQTCPHPERDVVYLPEGITICNHCYGLLDQDRRLVSEEDTPVERVCAA